MFRFVFEAKAGAKIGQSFETTKSFAENFQIFLKIEESTRTWPPTGLF